jgi:hypothetical protein
LEVEDPIREFSLTENNKEELYCSISIYFPKDKQKIYFPKSRVDLARKVIEQISINKSDTFLIWRTHSLIYNVSLVERVAVATTEGRREHMEGLSLLVLVMCWWRLVTLALWLE